MSDQSMQVQGAEPEGINYHLRLFEAALIACGATLLAMISFLASVWGNPALAQATIRAIWYVAYGFGPFVFVTVLASVGNGAETLMRGKKGLNFHQSLPVWALTTLGFTGFGLFTWLKGMQALINATP
ncbi:hypothetical protein HJB86_14595 [Rhizobium sp. NZLR3b]|uniref:hypothetical protein n=1 Tax=Rhizobium sp. NZLR3b TaxID=2731101 RepID=UPI001C82C9C5|nr:hypothetical protein [Rhizobium sp. NZLR3b]MBX5190136.1 hypothetical protein [Rhizobium sp. NZLR3b]